MNQEVIIQDLLQRLAQKDREIAALKSQLPQPVITRRGKMKNLREVADVERQARVFSLTHVCSLPCFSAAFQNNPTRKAARYHSLLEKDGLIDSAIKPQQFI